MTFGNESALEVFRNPSRHKLVQSIKQIQHDPIELEPVIDRAIDQALGDVLKRKNHPKFGELPEFWIAKIHSLAFLYIQSVIGQGKKIDNLRNRIRSYKSVFVVGAGISFEVGVPFTFHLQDILRFVRCDDYDQLRFDDDRCLEFKRKFKDICDEKQPSQSHRLLSLNLGNRIIDIICINWDDLIERAGEQSGSQITVINEDRDAHINGGYMWKSHGDIRKIEPGNIKGQGGWVFPDEGGFMFQSFQKYLTGENGLKNSLFVIVVVGYSGKDKRINRIIKSLEDHDRRPSYRIGLDLESVGDEYYIVGPSDYILPKILESEPNK